MDSLNNQLRGLQKELEKIPYQPIIHNTEFGLLRMRQVEKDLPYYSRIVTMGQEVSP